MGLMERLLRPKRVTQAGRALYLSAVGQARQPGLYRDLGGRDTVEGRFELYSLHVVLLLHRLKGQGPAASDTAQALFDAYVKGLDDSLREIGVGDLSVGKKMRKLGEAFFGRVKSYDEALGALPDDGPLMAVIARTALEGAEIDPAPLTHYAVRATDALAAQPLDGFLEGRAEWPQVQP